jgi:hypothetical protein
MDNKQLIKLLEEKNVTLGEIKSAAKKTGEFLRSHYPDKDIRHSNLLNIMAQALGWSDYQTLRTKHMLYSNKDYFSSWKYRGSNHPYIRIAAYGLFFSEFVLSDKLGIELNLSLALKEILDRDPENLIPDSNGEIYVCTNNRLKTGIQFLRDGTFKSICTEFPIRMHLSEQNGVHKSKLNILELRRLDFEPGKNYFLNRQKYKADFTGRILRDFLKFFEIRLATNLLDDEPSLKFILNRRFDLDGPFIRYKNDQLA